MKQALYVMTLTLLFSSAVLADTHYHIEVDGIACPFCLYGIEKKLRKLDGVTEIQSDLEEGRIFIKVADGATLSEDRVREAVKSAGFTLRSFEEIEPENVE